MNFCAYYQQQSQRSAAAVNQYHHQFINKTSGYWPLLTCSKVLDNRTSSPYLSSSPSPSSTPSNQQQQQQTLLASNECNYSLQFPGNLLTTNTSVIPGQLWSPASGSTLWSNRPESSFIDPTININTITTGQQVVNTTPIHPGRTTIGGQQQVITTTTTGQGSHPPLQAGDSIEQLTVEEVQAILTSVSTGSTFSSSQSQSDILNIIKKEPIDEEGPSSSRMLLVQSSQPTCFGANNNLGDNSNINIPFGIGQGNYGVHNQQHQQSGTLLNSNTSASNITSITDAALDSEDSAGGFEDLKLLDFPIYDPEEEDNFDEASLEEMFSPTSDNDNNPQDSPSGFVPSITRPTSVITPTTTCSSFASTSPAPSLRSRVEHMDIVMSTIHSQPVSVEIPSPTGSGTPTLPSFLETYSPRYRSGLVSGPSSTASSSHHHHQRQQVNTSSAVRPPLVQQSSTDAFFKYEDLMDDEGSSLSSEPILGTESLGHDSPILGHAGSIGIESMVRTTSRTSSPFISTTPTGLAFMKQEQFENFDQITNTPSIASHNIHHQQQQQPLSPVAELFSDPTVGLMSPHMMGSTGLLSDMGKPSTMVIKKEPSSRRSSRQSTQSFLSSGHRSSIPSGRSSIGSIESFGSLDQGRATSFSPSLSTHSTISPPLTPMTPPRTRGVVHRKSHHRASASATLSTSKSAVQQRGGSHSQSSGDQQQQQQKSSGGGGSGSSASTASSSTRSSASSSTHSSTTQRESSVPSGQQQSSTTAPSHGTATRSVCAVCGDIAACQHYGVRTCEGCKGFFKRTVQKGAKYVCLGSKDCVVDKRRRNRCQFCRFQKCLSVGMVKEVVRTDDLKGRRGRLPSKPKSPQESPPSPPVSTITALVRAHLDTNPDLSNVDTTQMSQVTHENVTEESVHSFYRIFHSSLETIRAFGEKIPGFNDLDKVDQQLLYQVSVLELFSLRFAFRNTFESDRLIFCNGTVLYRSQVELIFGSRWFSSIKRLSQHLVDMEMDLSALACLCALSLINERHGLSNETKVEQLQMKIISSLRDHCTYNSEAQKKSWYFSKILSILPELRTLSNEGMERMQQLNRIISMPENFRKTLLDTSFGNH